FFSSSRRHTSFSRDWSSDVCSSDLSALATCSAITMKMYAERKDWPLEEARVEVDFENFRKQGRTVFIKSVELKGNLDDAQRAKLLEIGGKCPIHRILTGEVEVNEELI